MKLPVEKLGCAEVGRGETVERQRSVGSFFSSDGGIADEGMLAATTDFEGHESTLDAVEFDSSQNLICVGGTLVRTYSMRIFAGRFFRGSPIFPKVFPGGDST